MITHVLPPTGNAAQDTANIQAAIDAVHTAGGGVLVFPTGAYLLHIGASGYALRLRPRVSLCGLSRGLTTLRLANGQGDYVAMLHHDLADSIDDVVIEHLVFDQNADGNPATYETEQEWIADNKPRVVIHLYKSKRLIIRDCRFTNCDNINTISVNGVVQDALIRDCIFDNHGASPINHDHSTIYYNGTDCRIIDCTFRGVGQGARSALETHNDGHIIRGCIVTGYQNGVNVVSNTFAIHDNIFTSVQYPLMLGWGSTLGRMSVHGNVT